MSLHAAKVERPTGTGAMPPLSPDEQKRRFRDLCEMLDADALEKANVVPLRPRGRTRKPNHKT